MGWHMWRKAHSAVASTRAGPGSDGQRPTGGLAACRRSGRFWVSVDIVTDSHVRSDAASLPLRLDQLSDQGGFIRRGCIRCGRGQNR